jgi:hypothetical protein
MGLSFEGLTAILKDYGVGYWTNPDRPAVLFGMGSTSGRRFMVGASVDGEGSFLQFRSVEYAHCPVTHRHFGAVATLLLSLNYTYRAIKFSVDPKDGEVTAYADLVLLDAEATPAQVMGLLGFFLNVLDEGHERLLSALVTGTDPGPRAAPPMPPVEAPADEPDDVV